MDARIAILLPSFWNVRNIVYSDVLTHLKREGIRVCLLAHDSARPARVEALPQGKRADWEPLLECSGRARRGKALLNSVIRNAFSRRNHISSYAIYRRWQERNYGLLRRLRSLVIRVVGGLAQPALIFDRLCKYEEYSADYYSPRVESGEVA